MIKFEYEDENEKIVFERKNFNICEHDIFIPFTDFLVTCGYPEEYGVERAVSFYEKRIQEFKEKKDKENE